MVKVCVSLPQCVYMLPPFGQNYYYSKKKIELVMSEYILMVTTWTGNNPIGQKIELKHSLLLQVLTKEC